MSDKEKKQPSLPKAETSKSTRAIDERRRALKKMTIAGGAAAVVGASGKWAKPVVDSVILPAHAQTSVTQQLGDISAAWFLGDDAPGSYDTGITDTTTVTDGFLYDDGTDMLISATLTPAAAVAVTASFDFGTTTFGALDASLPTPTASADSGNVDFGTFEPTNDDFGDTPGDGTVTLTLSAPGYNDKVITLNVS